MAKQISTISKLDALLQPYIMKAMESTKDIIFEIVWDKVNDYYNEPVFSTNITESPSEPEVYNRTGRLMEELRASNIKKVGKNYYFDVGWDDDYLRFSYPGNGGQKRISHFNPATGEDVLGWFNDFSHGGNVIGEHKYWDEALQEVNDLGGVVGIFKNELKKIGIKVK